MKPAYFLSFLVLAAALFTGTCSAATTTVGVGETIPVGGTTTTTTTEPSEPTTEDTSTEDSGSDSIIHQVGIVPADGSEAPSSEGSEWEGAEILGSGSTTPEAESPEGTESESPAEPTLYTEDESTPEAGDSAPAGQDACAPAFVLALLAAFASRS